MTYILEKDNCVKKGKHTRLHSSTAEMYIQSLKQIYLLDVIYYMKDQMRKLMKPSEVLKLKSLNLYKRIFKSLL